MALTCKGVFVIGAKRTPFCQYGGSLRDVQASHIFAAAAKEAMRSAGIDPSIVDCTVVGNINFLSQCDGGKTPRYCGIYSGVPIEKSALGVNKVCGTGLQAIITGAGEILTRTASVCLTGGTELMSSLPLLVRNVRFGTTLGKPYQLEDHIKMQLIDSYCGLNMHKITENLARKYKLSRQSVDEFTMNSILKWKAAEKANLYKQELSSVTGIVSNEDIVINKDDLSNMNVEMLSHLTPVVENGVIVTSGNSSAPADGAAALILANEEAIFHHNLTPLARVTAWACVGIDPVNSGLAAVSAIRRLLEVSTKKSEEIDLFEINETFAAQTMAVIEELKIDPQKVNISGGALSIGNPVAATGARMATHLVHQICRQNAKTAIAASSCGGGQGIAVLLETL